MRKSRLCALICRLSYIKNDDNSPNIKKIMEELKTLDHNFISIKIYNKGGTQALLIRHSKFHIAVFRGSDEEIDWANNFDYQMIERLGKLHRGFWRATNNVSNDIIYDIINLKKPLYITGHSLGGALATVFVHILNHRRIEYREVYTFGQPRVFSFATADKFNDKNKNRFFRYQNNNDGVCHLPPLFMGFKHVGALRYIDSNGISRHSIPLFDQLIGLIKSLDKKGIDFQEDHDINDYINAL